VDKQGRVMIARRKTSSSDHRGKALKPSTRSLFQTIKRTTKTTNHVIRNKISRRRPHVDLLTEFTIEKGIFDIKLINGPRANRGHSKESANSGHVSHNHEDYNERRAKRKNPKPKMSQQERKHQRTTRQEARDPRGDDYRCESHEVWNHKWMEEHGRSAQRVAEEMVEGVEMVGMVVKEKAQWR